MDFESGRPFDPFDALRVWLRDRPIDRFGKLGLRFRALP